MATGRSVVIYKESRALQANAALSQARDLQRAKDAEDRRQMLELVKRHSHKTAEEYNAAKAAEFMQRGKPPGQFTAAAYRDAE